MTIRTRAFVGLWVLSILAIGTIVFVLFSLNIGAGMDAERRRIGDILDTHSSLSRVLVELKNDQHYYALTGLTAGAEPHRTTPAIDRGLLLASLAEDRRSPTSGAVAAAQDHRRSLDGGMGTVVATCRA